MRQKYGLLILIFAFSLFNPHKVLSQWVQTSGPDGSQVNCFATIGSRLLAGTWYGIFLSTDNGRSWLQTNGDMTRPNVTAMVVSNSTLFAASSVGIFLSSDSGMTWLLCNNGLTDTFVTALAVNGNHIFAGTGGAGLFESKDTGSSWDSIGLTMYMYIYPLGVSGPNIIAIVNSSIFLSSDNGKNWTTSTPARLPPNAMCLSTLETKLFVGTNYGVFVSTHNGMDIFEPVNTGLIDFNIYSLLSYGSNLFAGTDGQVFLTTNEGAMWRGVSMGLPDVEITSLIVSDSILFAGTDNYGVWRRPLSEIIPTNSVRNVPGSDLTIRSYPNPLTEHTTINLSTSNPGQAEVSVINLLGIEVARIFTGELDAGEHSFTWNTRETQPGAYWCVIQMNGKSERMPLAVVR